MTPSLTTSIAHRVSRAAKILVAEIRDDYRFVLQHEALFSLLFLFIAGLLFFSSPPPPKKIVMLTGAAGMSYGQYGEKYKKFFEKNGFELELISTEGSRDNAKRLLNPQDPSQVAFVQAGTIKGDEAENITTLGSVFYEPIWVFFRGDYAIEPSPSSELARGKINIGKEGSGTNALANRLLNLNNLENRKNYTTMATPDAIVALEEKKIDGVLVVDTPDSPNIKKLAEDPTLKLLNFARADAYSYNLRYLRKVTLPMGALDLARNIPSEETNLVTTTAELLVKKDLHPAIQLLLMEAATEIHGDGTFFAKKGEFPSFKDSLIEPSEEAKIYYKNGSPFLLRYVPFRVAEYINRLFFYVFPIALIFYPIVTRFLGYRITRGQYRLHELNRSLRIVDREVSSNFDPLHKEIYSARLEEIEDALLECRLPREVLKDYFTLRKDIEYVRTKIARRNFADDKEP